MSFNFPPQFHIQNVFLSLIEKRKFMPMEACPRRFITVGNNIFTGRCDDTSLHEGLEVLAISVKKIYEIYEDTWEFFEPLLILKEDLLMLEARVPMIEKEIWMKISQTPYWKKKLGAK